LAGSIDRHRNPLWVQLAEDELVSALITDGHHLPDPFIRTAFRTKGPSRIVLTSDAAVPGGRPPGNYVWSGQQVEVGTDGRIALAGTPYLAGAGHLLDTDLSVFVRATGASWAEAVSSVTRIPGKLIGIPAEEFAFTPGAAADIVAFRPVPRGRSLAIETVLVEGAEP
jgi:N-acetylglucosamine-6-phosphate deacetylase